MAWGQDESHTCPHHSVPFDKETDRTPGFYGTAAREEGAVRQIPDAGYARRFPWEVGPYTAPLLTPGGVTVSLASGGGGLRQSPRLAPKNFKHLFFHPLDVRDSGRENFPHPLETQPTKVLFGAGWPGKRGPSTASPQLAPFSCFALGDFRRRRNPARGGTPAPVPLEYHKRRDVPAVVPVSRGETPPARTGWGVWLGVWGVCRSPVAGRGTLDCPPPSVRGCTQTFRERAGVL
ncbi:hypothetical protein GWK47_054384 [Chionoecetes opilio]|uniref:Uncharacterized protein n=1 Tax=Chionoecetes opilio TaxID=41210 RepID=A0A8J4XZT7_CHIOP|nr:hypothetical protein GWK47_054384 [Chionoecetes opilio]